MILTLKQHKRPRLSKVGDLDDDVSVQSSTLDESSEDDASMAEGVDEDGVAENDASEAGIDNDSDDYDPDIDDEEATRRYAESMRKRGTLQNHPALTAIIEEVTCTNFMCHAHLSMSMGPLINFIIGHNGSGKSAILTALQICLGGRATTTNRGQSLKSFIKQGTDRTSLLVRIKNQGELAYLPDLYGPSIIVERHFSMSGTSGFSIRNASGKQVSSKKSDLDDILDALSLQLDNPMNVLTQDMARQFLNSSSPADKYKFFIKGTHLEQLDTDYKVLSDSLDKNNTELYKLKEVRDKARMTVVEATKKVARAEEQRTMQDRASFVRRQVIWSQVRDREEKLSAIDQEIRETEEDIQTREQKVDQSAAKYERAEKARDEATKVIQQLKDLLTPKQRDKAQVLDFFQDNKKELLRLHTEMRDINGELKAAKKKVQNLNTHIEAENEKLANAEDGRHGEKLAEIQTAKDEITQLKERQQTHAADLDQLQRAILGAQDGAKRAYPLVSEKSAQVKACESTIASLSNPRESWQAAFPRSLPSLLRAINNEARFKELPVGPLGRSVSLLEPKWSSILEKSFGSALEGFAVTSKHDQLLLTEIMRKTGYPVRVFLGRADPIDTSGNEPSAEMTTWLRVLKIDNDLARNTFIINQRIDQTVLVTTQDEAGSMMMQGRIPYVGQIFAPRRDGGGFRYAFTNGGNQTQSPIDRWGGKPRMQTDAESRIA
jgi:chromosome segregation ATPase